MMDNYEIDQENTCHSRFANTFTASDSSRKPQDSSVSSIMENNYSHQIQNERDTRTKPAKPKKNKKNSKKYKKKDSLSVTEENLSESSSKLQVEKIDQVIKKKCKKIRAKNNVPKLDMTINCPISPPLTKSSTATPFENQTQGKSITGENESSPNIKNSPRSFISSSMDVECERPEPSSKDIEYGSNKHYIGMETDCVSTTCTVVETLENPASLALASSLSKDDSCCYKFLDDHITGEPLEIAKIAHENPSQEFSPPTATSWNDSSIEVIDGKIKSEPTALISDHFTNKFKSTEESDTFKAETALIFHSDEENAILTPVEIQPNVSVAKETDLNAIDKTPTLTQRQLSVLTSNELLVPPAVAGIDTTVSEKECDKVHNLDLGGNLNKIENSPVSLSIIVNSHKDFDTISNTDTNLGLGNNKIYAKKSQEENKSGFDNITEVKNNTKSNNSLPNIKVDETHCRVDTFPNDDAKFDPDERSEGIKVSNVLLSKEILNEEDESKNETNHELAENITDIRINSRTNLKPDSGISVSTSEVTEFVDIDLKKRECIIGTDGNVNLSEHEEAIKEEISSKIDVKDLSKTVRGISISSSSIRIPAVSLEEAVQKKIINEIHTLDIERNEEKSNHSDINSIIYHPNGSLSHFLHSLPKQDHIYEMDLSKDLTNLQESIGTRETSLTDSSLNQLPIFSGALTELTLEPSIIEPECITCSDLKEDMSSFLKTSNINELQKEMHGKTKQIPSNLKTHTTETNSDFESDLKSKKKNTDYNMRTLTKTEKEERKSEVDLDGNIHNVYRPIVNEQALAPELVIISKETLNHLHKKTTLMQAEISRLTTALNNHKTAFEFGLKSKNTLSHSTQQDSKLQANNEISVAQLPKLAKIQSYPRTKSVWKNLWSFGRKDTENTSTLSPQEVTRNGRLHPRASIVEHTESVSPKIKRYKVIGRVQAKNFPGENYVHQC